MDMLKSAFKISLLGLALIAARALGASSASAGDALVEEILKRQDGVVSVYALFEQEKRAAMLQRPLISKGDFYFKPGAGVRWEYEDVLVVYDGAVLYIYSPEMEEAEKIIGEDNFMGPLAFDIERLMQDYEVQARKVEDAIELTLTPKKEMPFSSMTMLFAAGSAFPSVVSIIEVSGDSAVIRFHDVELNSEIDEEMFTFDPPPGTEIRERSYD